MFRVITNKSFPDIIRPVMVSTTTTEERISGQMTRYEESLKVSTARQGSRDANLYPLVTPTLFSGDDRAPFVGIPTKGLVFYAPLRERDIYDCTGKLLTYYGDSLFETVANIPAACFYGTNYITVDLTTDLLFGPGKPYTISYWVLSTRGVSYDRCCVAIYDGKYVDNGRPFTGMSGNSGFFWKGGASTDFRGDENGLKEGLWHHILYTSNSSTYTKCYLDNVLKTTSTKKCLAPLTTNKLYLANQAEASEWYTSYDFNGYLSSVRIYNRELTDTERTALFNEW